MNPNANPDLSLRANLSPSPNPNPNLSPNPNLGVSIWELGRAQLLPVVWWHGATDPECDEKAMRLAGARLGEATAAAEHLQYTLCRALLVRGSAHTPGDPKVRVCFSSPYGPLVYESG